MKRKSSSTKRTSVKRTPRADRAFPSFGTTLVASVFDEPLLEFAHAQRVQEPHDGLSIFGPYDVGRPSKPKSINWASLRPPPVATRFWIGSIACSDQSIPERTRRASIWISNSGRCFQASMQHSIARFGSTNLVQGVDEKHLVELCSNLDSKKRAFDAVEEYLTAIRLTEKKR